MQTKKIVIITAQGFEDEEVIYPVIRFKEAGYRVDIATKGKTMVSGRKGYPLETLVKFYASLTDTKDLVGKAGDYDAVIIPGGFEAPDRVRQINEVKDFVLAMFEAGKPVAAVCHGPWVLISAGLLRGKKVTGYAGIIDDIKNAGAEYVDRSVVVDGSVITGRHARDIGEFTESIIEQLKLRSK